MSQSLSGLFVQNKFALAGDLHAVDRPFMRNKDFVSAPEKLAAFNDALCLASRQDNRRGIWFVRCHRLAVLVMAAENRGFFPFCGRVIAISILTSLLIFLYGRNTGFLQSSLITKL
jgi:hypothetical protein